MHTEHLQNVRYGLVWLAWFLAVSIAALILVALVAFHLIDAESAVGTRAAIVAVATGFFAGGMLTGVRAQTPPILPGTMIGLVSLFVWFVLNVISALLFPNFGWSALTPNLT